MDKELVHILLVDNKEKDYLVTRDLIKEIKGYTAKLDWEPVYPKALDKMVAQDYDIFLVDYDLGKLSGVDLMQEAFVHGCEKPFIILAEQTEDNFDIRAIKAGASDYLQKSLMDSYVLEKSILFAIERNKFKRELIKSQKTYKFLFEEIRNQNQIINSILNSLPVVISRLDMTGTIIDIFGSGLKTAHIDEEELIASMVGSLFSEPEVSIEKVVQNGFLSMEQKSHAKDGNECIFQSFYFFNAESSDIILFAIDITESKRTQEAYRQVNLENRKLNKINELLDNIIYMTAHDLRSPISNLKLITHLINETNDMDEKMELLEKVTESTNRMENVINGLVEIIEIQKEGVEMPQKVRFRKVFDHVYAEFQEELLQVNGEVHVDFSQADEIYYQEAFLISIFSNLIGNAIKYHSERPLEITVKSEKVPGFIRLSVSDNGIGIDLKKYLKTIFRPFSRIKQNTREGKGIGLHLVKTIVEKNGGSIDVESEPGKGSVFIVHLAEYSR